MRAIGGRGGFTPMKMQNLFPALALMLFVAIAAPAQNNNMLRGKVRSPSGETLNNAIVELKIGGGGMIGQTVTRNDGDFAFSNLEAGEYEIEVNLAGYERTIQMARFNHSPGEHFQEVLNIEVLLRPKAEPATGAPGINFAQDVPKAAREAYEKGIARLREGKTDEGVRLLREATTVFPNYFAAHLGLGAEMLRAGKYNDALESLERARQINDREGMVYHLFGLVMMKQRKFTVAEYAFLQATHLDGTNAAAHFYRGLALIEIAVRGRDEKQQKSDLAEAEKEMDTAWDLSDRHMTAVYLQRARIFERRGEKQAAAEALEKYLKAEPQAKNAAAIREAISKLRGQK